MARRTALWCAAVAGTLACSSATEPLDCVEVVASPVTPTAGTYDYVACDDAGQAVVRGTVVLTLVDTVVGGSWDLRRVPGTEGATVGPQVGTGQLAGWLNRDTLALDLNPGMMDNNVTVWGLSDAAGTIAGRWVYLTIAGPASAGPATMRKR